MVGILVHHGVRPQIPPGVFIADGAWVIGDVLIGEESSVWFNVVLRGDINAIRIGRRSNIQDGSILHVTHELSVDVGDEVTIGHKAIIHGCHIEDATLIGMGAVVLDRARVGPSSLVAAGAVVRESFVVPPGTLAAGVPARIVRDLTETERAELLISAHHYVEYARTFLDGYLQGST